MNNLNSYNSFNLEREDNSLLSENISEEKNKFIRLKKYIIYLRRYGSSSTIVFEEYKNFFNENSDLFIRDLGVRELISTIDTFIDFGNILEKSIALGITNFLFHEKIFLTTRTIYDLSPKKTINKDKLEYLESGFHSIRLNCDDSFLVFLKRLSQEYSKVEVLNKIWVKILKDLINNEKSSLNMIFKNLNDKMKSDYEIILKDFFSDGYFSKESQEKLEILKKESYSYGR